MQNEFRPRTRTREYVVSLVLCYGVLGYLVLTLEPSPILYVSCAVLAGFSTLMLGMLHRARAERRIIVGPHGIKIFRGRRLTHLPWSHVKDTRERWEGHGSNRHRRFFLLTMAGEEIELMRDGQYEDDTLILSLVSKCSKEAARE